MKKTAILLAAGIILAHAATAKTVRRAAQPAETTKTSASASSTVTFESPGLSTGLAQKWAVGFDSIPGASIGAALTVPSLTAPNAICVRYWTSDDLAVEGLLALASASGGASESVFGLGLGAKFNWKKPVDDVLIQWLGKFSFANDNAPSGNVSTVALWAGTGFEAFIPAWRALSVEGSVGLGFASQSTPGVSRTFFGVAGNGFMPLNVAIHYTFGI